MRKQINLLQFYAQIRCTNDVGISLGSGIFVQLRSVLYETVNVFVVESQGNSAIPARKNLIFNRGPNFL